MEIPNLLNDTRTISTITMQGTDTRDGDYYQVGTGHGCVNEIRVYPEPSEYCNRPWFAVIKSGVIVKRLNGNAVENVTYMPGG